MGKHGIGSHGSHSHSHLNNHNHAGGFSHNNHHSHIGHNNNQRQTKSSGFKNYNNPFQPDPDEVPESDANTFVLLYDPIHRGYDASAYDPSFADQNISKAEVDAFVGELNVVSTDDASSANCQKWLLPVIMVLCFGGILGATIGILTNLEQRVEVTDPLTGKVAYASKGIPITTAIVLVVVIDAILIACMIFSSICFRRCAAERLTNRRDAIMKVIDKYQPQFNAKNITIRAPSSGGYIALAKTGMPGVSAPPQAQMLMNNPALGGFGAGGQGMTPMVTPVLPPGFANPSDS